jgi:hypothetical protein
MYSTNKKLLEEGKIELLKDQLNKLESFSKSKEESAADEMRKIIEQYSQIKRIGPEVDLREYDSRLNDIVLSSDKKQLFY